MTAPADRAGCQANAKSTADEETTVTKSGDAVQAKGARTVKGAEPTRDGEVLTIRQDILTGSSQRDRHAVRVPVNLMGKVADAEAAGGEVAIGRRSL